MEIFGADFSGGKLPRGIYYSRGELKGNRLVLKETVKCDDRLDLFMAIMKSRAPWGLDFPFSVSAKALKSLEMKTWQELIKKAASSGREEFIEFLDSGFWGGNFEGRCKSRGFACRHGDARLKAFSPLKHNNPDMRAMLYSGLKLLAYSRAQGARVYPFDTFIKSKPRLYEVYPSHTWRALGLKRGAPEFARRFNSQGEVKVETIGDIESQHAGDAVVACATLAEFIARVGEDWDRRWEGLGKEEWDLRHREGLIVRLE